MADELDVKAIIVGTRGLSPAKMVFGSVSSYVMRHSTRAVILIK